MVFKEERNMKVHVFFAMLAIACGAMFGIRQVEWLIITVTITSVMTLEMVNTCIERIMNYATTDYDPKIRTIKDIAAGAVLTAAIAAVIIGLIVFIPYL